MNRAKIMDRYWVDFLIWYKDPTFINTFNGKQSISDLFWYWLVKIYAKHTKNTNFLDSLRVSVASDDLLNYLVNEQQIVSCITDNLKVQFRPTQYGPRSEVI